MLGRVLAKPLLVELHKLEMVRAAELRVKSVLGDDVAKASLGRGAFDELFVPGLRQVAELLRSNIADVNLMWRIGGSRIEITQMLRQLLAEGGAGAELAQRLGAIANQVRHVGQRIRNPFNADTRRFHRI